MGVASSPLLGGRYELLGRIASGGMAEVYAARLRGDAGFMRIVAVKRMLPHLATDPAFVEMFLDEARLAAHVHGAHVVSTLDLGRDADAAPYIVMELVIGVTLAQLMRASAARGGPLPTAIALEILADAALGLEEAHLARSHDGELLGVVHRDVSPQNILVGADGRARVADFGVARALLRSTKTETGDLKGKYAYFSPEQSRGAPLDARSDVFAMGIVCWETLTGERLFRADDPIETIERVRTWPVPPIERHREGVPEIARSAIMRALERDLDRRTPSAGQLASELRRAASEIGSQGPTAISWLVSELARDELARVGSLLRESARVDRDTATAVDSYLANAGLPPTRLARRDVGDAETGDTVDPHAVTRDAPGNAPRLAVPPTRAGRPSQGPRAARPIDAAAPAAARRRTKLVIGAALAVLFAIGSIATVGVIKSSSGSTGGARPEGPSGAPGPSRGVEEEPLRFPPRRPSKRSTLRMSVRELIDLDFVGIPPATEWRLAHELLDGTVVPVYVARVPSVENGGARVLPNGQFEVVWHLRRDARWSDGAPLTAEDVVLGYRVDPRPHLVGARVEAPGVVRVTWEEPVSVALEAPLPVATHVLGDVFERGGAAAVEARRRTSVVPTLGPYRVKEFVPSTRAVLEANPSFPGPAPAIARIEIERNADRDVTIRKMEAGELDLAFPNSILLDQARALRERRPDLVYIRPSSFMVFLQPDLTDPPFDRVDVRRALLTAIDRERIAQSTYGPDGRVAHAPTIAPPVDLERHPLDRDRAAEIVRREGLAGAEIRVLVAPDVGHDMATRVADDLRAVGLDASVHEVEEHSAYRDGRHGGLLMYAVLVREGELIDRFWGLPERGGTVDTSARNAAFDDATAAVLDRCNYALSPERRVEYEAALVRAYASRLPQLPLVFAAERVVADPALRGWDQPPGKPFGLGIEDWYFAR